MSEIIGYIGNRKAVPILLDGFRRLNRIDHDLTGLAFLTGVPRRIETAGGRLEDLESIRNGGAGGGCGRLGRLPVAVHGRTVGTTALPALDCRNEIAVVQKGTIENLRELIENLIREGHPVAFETGEEVLAHLIEKQLSGGLEEAVRTALFDVKGQFAIAVLSRSDPPTLIGVSLGHPLTIGLGSGEYCLASDPGALEEFAREQIVLAPGEIAELSRKGLRITGLHHGKPVLKTVQRVHSNGDRADKNGFPHYMLKEIHDQPQVIHDALAGRIHPSGEKVVLPEVPSSLLEGVDRVRMVGCGSSYHAALIGKWFMEKMLRLPVEVSPSSEFLDQDPIIDRKTLTVALSRGGETEDTVAALSEAVRKGSPTVALCNAPDSPLARKAACVIPMRAGREVGVTSTKTFTSQVIGLILLMLHMGLEKKRISEEEVGRHLKSLKTLPDLLTVLLVREREMRRWSEKYGDKKDFLLLGKGLGFPIAMEGALKFKEASYIHAEGCSAGEIQHGPIALIDGNMPVVVLSPEGSNDRKAAGNLEMVRARHGTVLAIATEGNGEIKKSADSVFYLPPAEELLHPFLMSVPLQLLAYHIGVRRNCVVDKIQPAAGNKTGG